MAAAPRHARIAALPLLWTTLAPAASYRLQPALGGLVFDEPVQLVFAPGETQRAFVAERRGRIVVVRDLDAPAQDTFLDLTARVGEAGDDRGLLALAFHPDFSRNGWFYVWYSMNTGGPRAMRLARFTATGPDRDIASLDSEHPLVTQLTGPGGHDGGDLIFGPEGYLYLSVGDGDQGRHPEAAASVQRIDRSFFGSIIRIDVDRRPENLEPNPHPAVHPGTFKVPTDNPFVGATEFNGQGVDTSRIRTEFWAIGFRNPFRMHLDALTGRLWVADVGLEQREEINLVAPGGNYGWPYREGRVAGSRTPPASATLNLVDPHWEYGPQTGRSITGGFVYRNARFPEFEGRYLFADFISGHLWSHSTEAETPTLLLSGAPGVVAWTVDPRQGDVLVVNLLDGRIKRLALAETGSRITNLSARAQVGRGENVLIPGFVIQGGSKTVLVRALGPVIGGAPFHVSGALQAPRLQLYRGQTLLESNAGWTSAPNLPALRQAARRVGAYPLPEDSADAALLTTLPAGLYSVVTSGMNDATGVAVVEVYDVDETDGPGRLINIAARAETRPGAQVVIAGFYVRGSAPRRVLLRVAGPSLARYEIHGALQNPVLVLYDEAGVELMRNVGWQNAPDPAATRAAMTAAGAFPFEDGSADCAVLVELPPGLYSVHALGASDTTGVVLVEVYEVPQ